MVASIELCDVTLGYERHPAVHHLSGAFKPGSLTAVVGPNGAGKTTLLKGVAGLLRPLDGRIALHGFDRWDIAYLPQQANIDSDFPISVFDAVMMGHWRRVGALSAITPALREVAAEALSSVGLDGFTDRLFGSLSAGQRQKALFARTMISDSPVILLDEPFTAIDSKTVDDLLAIVLRWHAESRMVVAVLHDFDQVRKHFPETLLLAREAIAWGRTADVLTSINLLKASAVSEAWDQQAPICDRINA